MIFVNPCKAETCIMETKKVAGLCMKILKPYVG